MSTIAELNDRARKQGSCRLVATAGVAALPIEQLHALMQLVKGYNAFEGGNDPHGERDFGTINFEGATYLWKIDYYADTSYRAGAKNPADTRTARVLTIMLASEY